MQGLPAALPPAALLPAALLPALLSGLTLAEPPTLAFGGFAGSLRFGRLIALSPRT